MTRLSRFRNLLTHFKNPVHKDLRPDAMLISSPGNRRYISGFTGSAGDLIITQKHALLATDFRYFEQVQQQAPDFELVKLSGMFVNEIHTLLNDLGITCLGFESSHVSYATYTALREAISPTIDLLPISDCMDALQVIKEPEELTWLQQAISITDAAYVHIESYMQPGMTEKEIAWELEKFVRENGADQMGFVIVASGPNGALPHARPTDRILQKQDSVVIDMGAVVEGYCADLTRSLPIGEPSSEYKQVYQHVLEAQEKAIQGIKPGMTGQEADAIARDSITEAGYQEYFGHGLGHGLGLAGCTNKPHLSHTKPTAAEPLQPGMVFTIEPGIYLPNRFGVRIEDDVLLEEQGVRILTQAPKRYM